MLIKQIKWPHNGGIRVVSLFRAQVDEPEETPCCVISVVDLGSNGERVIEEYTTPMTTLVTAKQAFTRRVQSLICGHYARATRKREFIGALGRMITIQLVEGKTDKRAVIFTTEGSTVVHVVELEDSVSTKEAERLFCERVDGLGGSMKETKRQVDVYQKKMAEDERRGPC